MPEVPTGQPGITSAFPPCKKSGSAPPEGVVTGTVGCEYKQETDTIIAWYYKETGDGATGWILRRQIYK